jgi:hypothetical protein
MRKQVFISHSSNLDPAGLAAEDPRRARLERAIAVRDAIVEKLDGSFDVWLDRARLRAGDPWRLEIFQALYRCSAGVILLDEDAFASPWVRQEATILNFRRRLNPGFVLIPVLLDEGSSGRFDEGDWRPMALRELMALKDSPSAVADDVAERLANLAELSDDEDLELWVTTLAGYLRRAAIDQPERLTFAAQQLGIVTPGDWAADNASATEPFARALLTAKPPAVAKVANLHLKAAVPNQEVRLSLSRLLRPIWVDLTAAACTALDVAAEYVDRAVYCAGGTVPIRSMDVFGEDPDELFDELEKLVIERCRPIRKKPSSENFAAWLKEAPHSRPVLFLRASLPLPQLGALLDRLVARFPGLTLFVLDGDAERSSDEVGMLGTMVIEPPLDPTVEGRADFYRGELELFVEA